MNYLIMQLFYTLLMLLDRTAQIMTVKRVEKKKYPGFYSRFLPSADVAPQ